MVSSTTAVTTKHNHHHHHHHHRHKILAKLEGKVFLPDRDVPFKHLMRDPLLIMGRSDLSVTDTDPFRPAADGVNVGLGISNKLSRRHARIEMDPLTNAFNIHCLGKNGLTITTNDDSDEVRLTPASHPHPLPSRTLIKLADCILVFTRPSELPAHLVSEPTKKRKRREWIKAEHNALRAQMMRLGYGRWQEIISATNGRLSERQPAELVPVARKFVARCYIHARPGVEQKALMEILREEPLANGIQEVAINLEINNLFETAKAEAEPGEKRKYVRWARKLRLLSRLRDVHDHPSLQRLRLGDLRVFTPPPALYWTSADDADLIIGSFRHGYGATEPIRLDQDLGFHARYSKSPSTRKPGTPSKSDKAEEAAIGSEEDEDDDEDVDEDEDERQGNVHDDLEDEVAAESTPRNPKKRLKLGDASAKKDDMKMEELIDANTADSDMSPEGGADSINDSKATKLGHENSSKDEMDIDKPKKKNVRLVPKRGPRIGNDDGFNNPEDAKAAAESMADQDGRVPFPSSESLMRRLKSIINSCAKEFDRDQRELKKKQLAASRAKQRKDDLAARKAEKEAEKNRQREERRIAKSQPFSKKEAVEFERALSYFGVSYKENGKTVDWAWFHSKIDGFDAKYEETLNSAYLELLSEAHRIIDLAAAKDDEDFEQVVRINEAKKASTVFSTLTVERAERLIERLQFFRTLRGEVLPHPKIVSVLRGFKKTKDLPLWWKSSHDRALLQGVDRHGVNGWECIGVDTELSFASSMKIWQRKHGNDIKSLKRAAMPKSTSGMKRAFALVRYFKSRASDPHFEHYSRDEEGSASGKGDSQAGVKTEKSEVKAPKVVVKSATYGARKVEERTKVKGKIESTAGATMGRPRTLRQTIIKIGKDENGNLELPASLGDGLFLLNLGVVREHEAGFCKNGIIFPVGFATVRKMGSRHFLCEILESSDGTQPEFRVSVLEGFKGGAKKVEDMWKASRIIGTSKNIVNIWMEVVNRELKEASSDAVSLASGPERFGLYESTIVYHIQKLAGAKRVTGFEMRDFSVKGGGARVEPSVGILAAMEAAIEGKLEKSGVGIENGTSDYDIARPIRLVAEEREMSIPEEWITSSKKGRRKSSTYWN